MTSRDPQVVRAALRRALGAPPSSLEIADGAQQGAPDLGEAEAAARLLADASPARLGLLARELYDTIVSDDKPAFPSALAALKFAHEMRLALLEEMG